MQFEHDRERSAALGLEETRQEGCVSVTQMVLPEDMKHWTLSSLQTRLIKTGGDWYATQGGWCFSLPRCW